MSGVCDMQISFKVTVDKPTQRMIIKKFAELFKSKKRDKKLEAMFEKEIVSTIKVELIK
jgi:hypothetical protein